MKEGYSIYIYHHIHKAVALGFIFLILGFAIGLLFNQENIQASAQIREQSRPLQIGEIETIDFQLRYQGSTDARKTLHFLGASYLKVHIASLDLLPGTVLKISDPEGQQVYTYPGSLYTIDEQPGFWALSILGDTVIIELKSDETEDTSIPPAYRMHYQEALDGASPNELGVVIDMYARGYPEVETESNYGTDSTCGSNQRTDVACYEGSYPTEFDESHAVARLLTSGIYLCTGWRASEQNRVFTNEHCVTSQSDVSATEVRFNYQRTTCGGDDLANQIVVTGNTLLVDNYNYDVALFTVNDFESITSFGFLDLDVRTPELNEEIYIPQHGNGDPKQFGIESDMNTGNVCRIDNAIVNGRTTNSDTGYFCDTIGGSSGSPVLARSSHAVIALHHFGISGLSCTSSDMNQGVRIDLIWPLVESYFDSPPDIGPLVYDDHNIDDDQIGESSGNNNGNADCGESLELFVDLLNQGTGSSTGISATISTSDPYVTWLENTSSAYPDINGGATGTNSDDFELSISPITPNGHTITFNLDLSASNAGPWDDSFDINVSCAPPLVAPTNLISTPISSRQIDLSWQDNASDETGYRIERSQDGSTGWIEIASLPANSNSYSDSDLDCNSGNHYRVRAYRSGDNTFSDYSNVANDTTYACKSLVLNPGWNLLTLPLQPINPFAAQSLLDEINAKGGNCSEIDRWRNGGWEAHVDGEIHNNYNINLGEGYFVKCAFASTWEVEGSILGTGVILNLGVGWNLIGVPYPESGYTAQSLLDSLNALGDACSEIDRWQFGNWNAHVDGLPFNDFGISTDQGYFVKCSQPSILNSDG